MLFDGGTCTSAMTGPSARRTEHRELVSRQRLHGRPETACDQSTPEELDHRPVDEHDGDTAVALGDVDDLEVGDVDAEFRGEREHLGGGAGAVRNRDPYLGELVGVDDSGRQVAAGVARASEPCRAARRDRRAR